MAHMHCHRPAGYGASYYEADKEVISTPCDSYSSEYRVQEYANPGYSAGYHHHHNGGYAAGMSEVVSYGSNPGYMGHHHHSGATDIVEKREEIVYDNAYDPCRRMC